MIYAAIGLFALAALLGLTILIKWLSKSDASNAVKYAHGLAAATALVLLVIYSAKNQDHFPKISIILFVIAALGGFYMFIRDMSTKYRSIGIAAIHALLAVSGFVALLLFAFA
ncbi:MAG: hypothetical protein JWN78_2242 [Bacteroidota bacterium]|nr:hypothetical protein [Bacteroidota bacterium]